MDRNEEENSMTAYGINYRVGKNENLMTAIIDAKDIKSAKKKIGRTIIWRSCGMKRRNILEIWLILVTN